MTNWERYRTAEARFEAFTRHCETCLASCNKCLKGVFGNGDTRIKCAFEWLGREAPAEEVHVVDPGTGIGMDVAYDPSGGSLVDRAVHSLFRRHTVADGFDFHRMMADMPGGPDFVRLDD